MKLTMLVAAMGKEPLALAEEMGIECDALIVSQGDRYGYEETAYKGHRLRCFFMRERGVGLSRNHALMRADSDIALFADEDIVYEKGYADAVLAAFKEHPRADMILFNVQAMPGRETYHIESFGRVRRYNCGRYSAYSCAVKVEEVYKRNIAFSLLFGGGARYSNGEDSLFIQECIRRGMKVYKVPVLIGREKPGESTWFRGYNEKFFYDRGVLYHYMYGHLASLMAFRFLLAHRGQMCQEIRVKEAGRIMRRGIREA